VTTDRTLFALFLCSPPTTAYPPEAPRARAAQGSGGFLAVVKLSLVFDMVRFTSPPPLSPY
jgi:hypothetical protein